MLGEFGSGEVVLGVAGKKGAYPCFEDYHGNLGEVFGPFGGSRT